MVLSIQGVLLLKQIGSRHIMEWIPHGTEHKYREFCFWNRQEPYISWSEYHMVLSINIGSYASETDRNRTFHRVNTTWWWAYREFCFPNIQEPRTWHIIECMTCAYATTWYWAYTVHALQYGVLAFEEDRNRTYTIIEWIRHVVMSSAVCSS